MDKSVEKIISNADSALSMREYEQAERLYLEALALDENSASAHYGLGTIALNKNRLKRALISFERASSLEPEAADIAFNYGYALSLAGQKIEALIAFQRASKYCRDDPVFCGKLAEVFLSLKEPNAAIQMLARLNTLLPADQLLLAKAHGALNRWKEAINVLTRLSKERPNDALVLNELSIAAASHRDYTTAISSYEKYLEIVTPNANDYLRFSDLLLIAQLPDQCAKAIDSALELGEDGAEVYMLKAKVHRLNADYEQANQAIDEVLKRMPNHGQAWNIRSELAGEGQLSGYIATLTQELAKEEQVLALNHHHQALLNYALAQMQERLKDYQAAAESFRRANGVQQSFLVRSSGAYDSSSNELYTDQTIEQFSQQVMSMPGALNTVREDLRPIFIVGVPRSGTTLVERILGQNSDVFNAGELEAIEFVATDFQYRQRSGKLPSVDQISPEQWHQLRSSYLEKIPDISTLYFTDKMPHNFRNVGLILKLFPEARVIQMHRAIKDVCLSIYCHAFSEGHNYATSWSSLEHFYNQSERLMKHWASLNSDRVLDLNYEDLVQYPKTVGKQLVEFCGFAWNEDYLEFHQSINQSFTFSEMEVRQPIADKRVDRWRNYELAIPELAKLK